MYDLIIIGAGPAGMTAAIYAARRKLNFLIISLDVGGQMNWSSEVDNYPGVRDSNGIELTNKFHEHMKDYKIKVKNEEVKELRKKSKICRVQTNKRTYESKSVIIASGKKPKKLNVPGEKELSGKGVSYCATCDAPLYKGKKVAVVGGGNSGLEAALFLSKHAKKVYVLEVKKKLRGASYLKDKVLKEKKIKSVVGVEVREILGDKEVKGLKYINNNKENKISLEGVFIEVGLMTKAEFTKVRKNKWGEIKIFRSTESNKENLTNKKGIFAAGDCTDIPAKQIIVAGGEGCKACLGAIDYINKWDKKFKEN